MEELTIDENLYDEVIYKINVKRLNLISSVYPIGLKFSVLAARKMERGPKMTKGGGEGGRGVERDTLAQEPCDLENPARQRMERLIGSALLTCVDQRFITLIGQDTQFSAVIVYSSWKDLPCDARAFSLTA